MRFKDLIKSQKEAEAIKSALEEGMYIFPQFSSREEVIEHMKQAELSELFYLISCEYEFSGRVILDEDIRSFITPEDIRFITKALYMMLGMREDHSEDKEELRLAQRLEGIKIDK